MTVPLLHIVGWIVGVIIILLFIRELIQYLNAPDTSAADYHKAGEKRYRRGARSALFG
jgi:hypothetical protein